MVLHFTLTKFPARALLLSLAALLAACGGGGGSGSSSADRTSSISQPATTFIPADPSAPQTTGNTATDGFNWFNFRRQQVGVQPIVRNSIINTAAQRHTDYQRLNNVVSHQETPGLPGFSGVEPGDRLLAAGYQFSSNFAYGEVISNTGDPSGFAAAEELIGAIYHRFVIFEPTFREVGTGSATDATNGTYFTAKLAANGSFTALGPGQVVVYPFANQQEVTVNFLSDNEVPDPVPGRNEVGYPISVHADITGKILVQSFTVRPRSAGASATPAEPLATRLLARATDPSTPESVAAIIPLAPLQSATTYDVAFNGSINGVAVQRNWSFTTR